MGQLSGKARILCTHHISYLWDADSVIVMEDGRIVASGPPTEVLPAYTDSIKRKAESSSQGLFYYISVVYFLVSLYWHIYWNYFLCILESFLDDSMITTLMGDIERSYYCIII